MHGVSLHGFAYIDGDQLGTQAGSLRRAAGKLRWKQLGRGSFPRFGRLDPLSRWALACVELLGLPRPLPDEQAQRTALLLGSELGCLSADLEFLASLDPPELASPTAFTYTLPSQAAGEIAVRWQIQGEVSCLMGGPDSGLLALWEGVQQVAEGRVDAALCVACEAVSARDREPARRLTGLRVNAARAFLVSNKAGGLARITDAEGPRPWDAQAEQGPALEALQAFLTAVPEGGLAEKSLSVPAPSMLHCEAWMRFSTTQQEQSHGIG